MRNAWLCAACGLLARTAFLRVQNERTGELLIYHKRCVAERLLPVMPAPKRRAVERAIVAQGKAVSR